MSARLKWGGSAAVAAAVAVAVVVSGGQDGGGAAPRPPEPSRGHVWVVTGTCDSTPRRQRTPVALAAAPAEAKACTFDQAWDVANAGDVIGCAAGAYPAQRVDGAKPTETTFRCEKGTTIAGAVECAPEFGSTGAFCAYADNMTLQNVTLDSGDRVNPSSGAQVRGAGVTFRNVDLHGTVVALSVDGPDFTWRGGSHGEDGVVGGPLTCREPAGVPTWIFKPGATLDGIRFNAKTVQKGAGQYCGDDDVPHLETIRLEAEAADTTIANSRFVEGSDAGSGHIFSSVPVSGLTLVNNVFEPVNGTYSIQAGNPENSGWKLLYNTFMQAGSFTGTGFTWVGNLGVAAPGDCSGTRIANVWQGEGSCGSDTFAGTSSLGIGAGGHLQDGSPAIDAGESDQCTGDQVAAVDFEGDARPTGDACDAGADEFTGR